jgi:transcriptional regulator with XRE-family HTH domain
MYKFTANAYDHQMAEKYNGITKEQAGSFLRERRTELKLRQEDVADGAGIPHANTVLYYEKGKHDVRASDYLPAIIRTLNISVDEARSRLGLDALYTSRTDGDERIGAQPIPQTLMLRNLGTVAAMHQNMQPGKNGRVQKPILSPCPLAVAHKYSPEELFILTVSGDSMACQDVQKAIPNGAHVLFLRVPGRKEPRKKDVVVAWIPSINSGVLKEFNKLGDEVVLESYNPYGARFPARAYPDAIIQGISLGYWLEFN